MSDQTTAMILTYNEEANIARTLRAVAWVSQVLIVDSGSTDGTLAIAAHFPEVRVIKRKFDTFADQCNFGLDQITTTWVLSLDADYELTLELSDEIRRLSPAGDISGYEASFVYKVFGHALSAALYPPRTILYRRNCARYRNEGHGHRVDIEGKIGLLKGVVFHDDRKGLQRWFISQQTYARCEADFLLSTPHDELRRSDRIRLMAWPAPIAVFLYTLFWKRCILNGWPGWLYVLQRTVAEAMIAMEIINRKMLGGSDR